MIRRINNNNKNCRSCTKLKGKKKKPGSVPYPHISVFSCNWWKYLEVVEAGRERKASNRTAYGEGAESAWVISALLLLRTGSTFRNKVLFLLVDLGKGGSPKEAFFQWWREGSEAERSLTPQSIIQHSSILRSDIGWLVLWPRYKKSLVENRGMLHGVSRCISAFQGGYVVVVQRAFCSC